MVLPLASAIGIAVFCLLSVQTANSNSAEAGEALAGAKQNELKGETEKSDKRARGRENPLNLKGHGGPIKSIAVNVLQTQALTGSFDYSMMHWQLGKEASKTLQRFDDFDGAVNAVEFLPGDKRAISGGDDGSVAVWDLESGRLVKRFKGHTAKIVDIDVTTDGRFAASAGWDRSVRIWNLEKMEAASTTVDHGGPVNSVVFATYKKKPVLYSASYDGQIRRWDIATGKIKRILYRHGWGINVLQAVRSKESDLLIFGSLNGVVAIVDPESGEIVRKLKPHDGPVLSLALTRDQGLLATGGGDGIVRVWSVGDWKQKEEYTNPYGPIWALGFVEGGKRLYYAGLDDFVTSWQVNPRKRFEPVAGEFPRKFQVTEASSDGELHFLRKCSICHTLTPDGGNKAGPTLYKLFGRKAGAIEGYSYSNAIKNSGIIWDDKTITALFELGPEHFTPGSKMPLQKITDGKKIEALVAYLKKATNGASQTE